MYLNDISVSFVLRVSLEINHINHKMTIFFAEHHLLYYPISENRRMVEESSNNRSSSRHSLRQKLCRLGSSFQYEYWRRFWLQSVWDHKNIFLQCVSWLDHVLRSKKRGCAKFLHTIGKGIICEYLSVLLVFYRLLRIYLKCIISF